MHIFGKYCVKLCIESTELIKDPVHDLNACITGQETEGYTNTPPELQRLSEEQNNGGKNTKVLVTEISKVSLV